MTITTTTKKNAVAGILMLLLWQLMASTHAFVPPSRPSVVISSSSSSSSLGPSKFIQEKSAAFERGPTSFSLLLRSTRSENNQGLHQQPISLSRRLKQEKQQLLDAEQERKNCLELDSVGRLRLCNRPDILLQGLDPQVWSATRAVSGKTNSLFLHTSHPESLPEHQTSMGSLISCRRLLACARQNRYWMGPKTGSSAKDIPFDTQFLLIEIEPDEQYALMLPLVDNGFRASINHQNGQYLELVCAAESGDAAVTNKGMRALYVAVGDDPYKLIKEGFANVAQTTKTFDTLDNKQVPPSVNDFGWCTWDAFYSAVEPQGILEGVQALREAGVPPRTLILDDGWQQVNPAPPSWLKEQEQEQEEEEEANKQVQQQQQQRSNRGILSAIVDAVANPFIKLVTTFYDNVVRTSAHGSWPNRVWSILANTILKPGLWNFFDTETDFNRQLDDFQANQKFEEGNHTLKSLVSELKTDHGIQNVYCWHALHGYWRGVSEDLGRRYGLNVTNLFPKPTQSLMKLEPHSAWDPVSLFGVGVMTNEKDLERFYTHLHTPLVEAGVDGVKVDVQSGVSSAGDGLGGGPHISKLYMKAMEASVSKRFPSSNSNDGAAPAAAVNCINCMCHSTENLYRHKATSVARASEDFFPDRPESHTAHLVNVGYNSLFLGEICLPDWDMFHSLHESAELHAAARAIGGCPVYVSDKPREHDPKLLRKLVLPDGTLLRAQEPGRPSRDCLFEDVTADEKTALKIWNVNPGGGGGVVGAFNVQGVAWNFDTNENEVLNDNPGSLTTTVKPYDIEYLRNTSGPFVAWRHKSGTMEFLEDGNTEMTARLKHRDWEIFTIAPIQIQGHLMFAPLGLADMMNSGGAIVSPPGIITLQKKKKDDADVTQAQFESRGPGRFVAFTNTKPSKIFMGGDETTTPRQEIQFVHNKQSGELSFHLPREISDRTAHHVTVEWNH